MHPAPINLANLVYSEMGKRTPDIIDSFFLLFTQKEVFEQMKKFLTITTQAIIIVTIVTFLTNWLI